jgi:hypothetical protein
LLRKRIESISGPLTDAQFQVLSKMLDEDIKFNQISFRKRTTLPKLLNIAAICAPLARLVA